jgi:DNA polymerase IV
MPLALNHNPPRIMHVDLNSCFATIEQQANPLLRGKPIVVAAYDTPNGCVVAPSIEAKRYGIKTGMTVRDARLLYPRVIVRTPDPSKYRFVHLQFRKIFQDYSPDVTPKSIDEAVIDLTYTESARIWGDPRTDRLSITSLHG